MVLVWRAMILKSEPLKENRTKRVSTITVNTKKQLYIIIIVREEVADGKLSFVKTGH